MANLCTLADTHGPFFGMFLMVDVLCFSGKACRRSALFLLQFTLTLAPSVLSVVMVCYGTTVDNDGACLGLHWMIDERHVLMFIPLPSPFFPWPVPRGVSA